MAHSNLFTYGIGYYGTPNAGVSNCETDMYGSCTSPGGPSFPELGYKKNYTQITALSQMQKNQLLKSMNQPRIRKQPFNSRNLPQNASGIL